MEDIFIEGTGKCVLLDTNKESHEPVKFTFHGGNCEDPHDVSSCTIFTKGSSAIVVFELPVRVEPTIFKIIYSYKRSWKEKEEYQGEININLPK